jgi:photosystem II stability/assembly factor-like uncharacterized protein
LLIFHAMMFGQLRLIPVLHFHDRLFFRTPVVVLLALLILPLQAQKTRLNVEAGNKLTFLCGDTLHLNALVSDWLSVPMPFTGKNEPFPRVEFGGADFGILAGAWGSFYRTTDGGASWSLFGNYSMGNYHSLCFPNDSSAFIGSTGGALYVTRDRGASWDTILTNMTHGVLFFLNPDTGYSGEYGQLFRTTDGGKTWNALYSSNFPGLYDLLFFNDTEGLAFSDYGVYRTANGGQSWTSTSPHSAPGYSRLGDSVLFTSGATGYFLRSTDQGKTWTSHPLGYSIYVRKIDFINANEGVIIGYKGEILETSDGGTSWIARVRPLNTSAPSDLFLFPDGRGFITCESSYLLQRVSLEGVSYRWSFDGGEVLTAEPRLDRSFNKSEQVRVELISEKYEGQDSLMLNLGMMVVNLQDQQIECGDSARLQVEIIEYQRSNFPTFSDLYFNYFFNESSGFAVGEQGLLLRTTDGGQSWIRVEGLPAGDAGFTGIQFTDNANGYICGSSGTILKTTDGGSSWQNQTTGSTSLLYSLFFTGSDEGYTCGTNGEILKTTDGGSSWLPCTSGTTAELLTIVFTSGTNGFAGGDQGLILRTSNAGLSWQATTTGTTESVISIAFSDALHGIAGCTNGVILRTENGGTSWTRINSPLTKNISTVAYLDSNTAIAMGVEAAFSADGGLTWSPFQREGSSYIYNLAVVGGKGFGVGADGEYFTIGMPGGHNFEWSPASNISDAYAPNPRVAPRENRTYRFRYTSPQGCEMSDSVRISIRGLSINGYAYQSETACGDTALLSYENWVTDSIPGQTSVLDLFFLSDQTGFACGSNNFLSQTTDGGETWTTTGISNISNVRLVRFGDQKNGILIGNNMLTTSNGGITWHSRGSGFNDAWFVENNLAVVAAQGRIMRLWGAGLLNQQSVMVNDTVNFLATRFISSTTGFISTSRGDILKTTDKGVKWNKVFEYPGRAVYSFFFLSPSEGYAAGTGGLILKTTDGGDHWTVMPQKSGLPDFKRVSFLSSEKAYAMASGGIFFESLDGGAGWKPVQGDPGRCTVFFFLNGRQGFAGGNSNKLYRYTTAGFNSVKWDFVSSPPPLAPYITRYVPMGNETVKITATMDSGCIATDEVPLVIRQASLEAGLSVTCLSGDSISLFPLAGTMMGEWTRIDQSFSKLSFYNPLRGYALKGTQLYRTVDGGKTWTYHTQPDISLMNIYFTDEKRGYSLGESLYTTTDGGKSWKTGLKNVHPSGIRFHSAKFVYVMSQTGMFISTDFGSGWKKTATPGLGSLSTFTCLNDCTIVTAMNDGSLYLSRNCGKEWKLLSEDKIQEVSCISYTDSLQAFIGAGNGIYKSINGGKNWELIYPSNTGTIVLLNMNFGSRGFAVYRHGVILETADGGRSWYRVPPYLGPVSDCEAFLLNNHFGWLSFGEGLCMIYNDRQTGGFSWSSQGSPWQTFTPPLRINPAADQLVQFRYETPGCETAQDSTLIRVLGEDYRLRQLDIPDTSVLVYHGDTDTLTCRFIPENAWNNAFEWQVKDKNSVAVDLDGVVNLLKDGNYWVYAVSENEELKDSCRFHSVIPVQAVGMEPDYYMVVNHQSRIAFYFEPSNPTYTHHTATVQDTTLLEIVSDSGSFVLVKSKKIGSTRLEITMEDPSLRASCLVHIMPVLEELDFDEDTIYMIPGEYYSPAFHYSRTSPFIREELFGFTCADTSIAFEVDFHRIYAKKTGSTLLNVFYSADPDLNNDCLIMVQDKVGTKSSGTSDILVYPNPGANRIYVNRKGNEGEEAVIRILDLQGRCWVEHESSAGQVSLPVSNLPVGLYIISVREKQKSWQVKWQKVNE